MENVESTNFLKLLKMPKQGSTRSGLSTLLKKTVTVSIVLGLSACATYSDYDGDDSLPEVEDRIIIDGKALPLPDENIPSAEPLSDAPTMSPVVSSLLSQARDQRRLGNWNAAAMLLERALRIEPRTALIWSRLANIRFDQGAWSRAIQLGAKSNTLAGRNIDLKRQNWILMANSYEKLGDTASAQRMLEKLNP